MWKKYMTQAVDGERVRSRAREYEEGEKSSKYFLTLEKINQAKKAIYQLQDQQGRILKTKEDISAEIVRFYSELYDKDNTKCEDSIKEEFFSEVRDVLTEDQMKSCEGFVTHQEILAALKQTSNNKSPGIDGIPADFYKVFWNDIASYLVNAINKAFQKGEMSVNHRRGIISLIPKKNKDSMFIKNWRPITLLCADYKLLSKAIANRIKVHLVDLIHTDQSGFVKDRYIGQNIDLLCQIIEQAENNNKPGIILTADFEKAFDKLNWSYMEEVLLKYNFGTMLIKWVKLLYTNVSAVVNVNGWFTTPFSINRGVKQGDPLSPYLFILCVEILGINIRVNDSIKGIKLGNTEHKLSMFADDTNMFIDYCITSLNNVLSTLGKFSQLSGLKINFEKSVAYCIGVKPKYTLKPVTPILWSESIIDALGVRIPVENRKDIYRLNYESKIASMEGVIKAWSKRNLSLRGKVTVIKSLLISKFQYLISVLGIPDKKIIVRINKAVFKFLWNGSEKLKRKTMFNPREEGGMYVPDFETVCKSVMVKWVYRYLHAPSSNWKQMVDYTLNSVGAGFVFKCNLCKNEKIIKKIQSPLWRDIVTSWCELNYKGPNTLKQDDIMWLNSNTGVLLYNKSCIENGLLYVGQIYDADGVVSLIDLNNTYKVKLNVTEYHNIVYGLKLSLSSAVMDEVEDKNCTHLVNTILHKPGDKFINKKVYSYFIQKKVHYDSIQNKWKKSVEIEENTNVLFNHIEKITIDNRLRSFQFKFLHNIIYFNDRLFKFKLVNTTLCEFCNENIDSIEHRYFYCRITQNFWSDVEMLLKNEYNVEYVINNAHLIVTNICESLPLVKIIMLNAKYYLYKCFLNKCQPNIQVFKGVIYRAECTERFIASKKNILHIHNCKWKPTR